MKFVHMADMHFDSPFTSLGNVGNLGDIRRLEQRKIFKKVVDYIKENDIEYLFISGDLYEHEYIRKSSIQYINNLFKEIENTKIFIAPGNHDPYIKNSYYDIFEWNENVTICKQKMEQIKISEDVDIYMTAFTDFYMDVSPIEKIEIENKNKINILITHCDLNGSKDAGFAYNPILESKLKNLGFDYVAMGHIHKSNIDESTKMVYPGSPISFGFDELGEHGMVVGEIDNQKNVKVNFIKLDERLFTKYELNVDNIESKEALIEKIDDLKLDKNNMYEIVLIGNREFDIDIREILKLISIDNILKIKDDTKIKYDIEEIMKENNLRGIFIREIIKKYKMGLYTEKQIEKAIEIGLEVM